MKKILLVMFIILFTAASVFCSEDEKEKQSPQLIKVPDGFFIDPAIEAAEQGVLMRSIPF